MEKKVNAGWTQRAVIYPVLRFYRRILERQIAREIKAGTYTRELSTRVDALTILLEE
jgi:hypothetical protein